MVAGPRVGQQGRDQGLDAGRGAAAAVERLADEDWTTLSQAGLEPVNAGRFYVSTRAHAKRRKPGQTGLVIEAGLAFGTGQHATTSGCLVALDRLARSRRFDTILDLGTGTGVLALAAHRTWRYARVVATDIDPIAITVARANARVNAVPLGLARGCLEFFAADGMHDGRLSARAPYDLICANILAAPLIALAGDIGTALAPRGVVILAGLLDTQVREVTAAYAARGLRKLMTSGGEWPTLVMRR